MFVKILQMKLKSRYSTLLNYFFSSNNENNNDWAMDNKTLNNIAIQNPFTLKPGTTLSASKISNVLITNKNKPKVTTVIGRVRITKIGFKKANKKPKTSATSIATE